MFDRAGIKEEAKAYYKEHFKTATLLILIFSLISCVFGGNGRRNLTNFSVDFKTIEDYKDYIKDPDNIPDLIVKSPYTIGSNGISYQNDYSYNGYVINGTGLDLNTKEGNRNFLSQGLVHKLIKNHILFLVSPFILIVISLLIALGSVFIVVPMVVGKNKALIDGLRNRDEEIEIGSLFYYFKNNYMPIVGKMLMKRIYIFLWFIVFIFPGIYKTFQYYFVEYILADNPDMPLEDAISLSIRLTDGCKFDIFIMGLSFLGWAILCILTLGLGSIILNPYIEISFANLYLKLLEKTDLSELDKETYIETE